MAGRPMNLGSIPGSGQSFLYSSKLTNLTEVLPCFFFSCKANARVKTRKDGARPALFLIFVLFYVILCCSLYFCVVLCIVCFVSSVLFVCICVLNYCQRVATQLQLNISYRIISYHKKQTN